MSCGAHEGGWLPWLAGWLVFVFAKLQPPTAKRVAKFELQLQLPRTFPSGVIYIDYGLPYRTAYISSKKLWVRR